MAALLVLREMMLVGSGHNDLPSMWSSIKMYRITTAAWCVVNGSVGWRGDAAIVGGCCLLPVSLRSAG